MDGILEFGKQLSGRRRWTAKGLGRGSQLEVQRAGEGPPWSTMMLNRTLSDDALLKLFRRRPDRAWRIFLDRYSGRIIGQLRALGLDRDEAMDGFVFVCERLAEDGFRRLRQIRHTGQKGELVPWLRQVVKHSAIDWGWSQDGRQRLFRSVAALGELDQRVFQLHFWAGLKPAAIVEALRAEGEFKGHSFEVFDALERVFECLDAGQRWRLLSQLSKRRTSRSIDGIETDNGVPWEPISVAPDPEAALLRAEQRQVLDQAVAGLAARDRLIFRLRYDDGLSLADIAAVVSVGLTTVKASLRTSRTVVRGAFGEVAQ